MPFFSIIIPVYNVEDYLSECIRSVLTQTFNDWECILVDDGSPDNCPQLCDEYAEQDKRIKVIHKKNGGMSDARNAGILAATGEYIVLLDSDDYLVVNDALQNLYSTVINTNENIIYNANITLVSPKGVLGYDRLIIFKDECSIFDFYSHWRKKEIGIIAGWSFVTQRAFLLDKRLFFKKGILHEDVHWIARLLCSSKSLTINHYQFYAYRQQREGSIMASMPVKRVIDKIIIIKDFLSFAENNNSPFCKEFYYWRVVYLWNRAYIESFNFKQNDINTCKKNSERVESSTLYIILCQL